MFGFKRRGFRRRVDTEMSYLVGFNEPYRKKLVASVEGIDKVIDNIRSEGCTPLQTAVDIWTILFSYEIERSPQLRADKERIEQFILDGGGEAHSDTEEAVKIFLVTLDKQVVIGKVGKERFDMAVPEILGALDEIDRNTRSALRMKALTDSFRAL